MLMDVYVSGSTNINRIAGRARLLTNMFLDMRNLRIDVRSITEWDAALWVRSRVASGIKTAGASSRTALALAERFTSEPFFADSALVKAQAFPKMQTRADSEQPKMATPPTWKHVEAMERVITDGATEQQRIVGGFFALLIHSSHRCSNGQRTRKLKLTDDAIMGESLLKGKRTWTEWAAARQGFFCDDWAGPWLMELKRCGMPGHDFLIRAPNSTLDRWLSRPATYADFNRAWHLLLMVYGGESPQTVVEYTPHGCRHIQVTAATQLAAQGLLGDTALEAIGHWERGSKMPRHYDTAKCVTELQARKSVTDAVRSGWRPAEDGNLPMPATPAMQSGPCPGTPNLLSGRMRSIAESNVQKTDVVVAVAAKKVMVLNTQRRRVHLVDTTKKTSVCGWWSCGSRVEPAWNADFNASMVETKCSRCFCR